MDSSVGTQDTKSSRFGSALIVITMICRPDTSQRTDLLATAPEAASQVGRGVEEPREAWARVQCIMYGA
ncbi:MAG: hypothetical protein NZ762_04385 [Dehalococcoidia bacterium]|nr:hypothetical protein [Dehalococcoidia bacterium]